MKKTKAISRRRKLTFSVIVSVAIFSGLECLLRITGFEASTRVESMAFTFPMDDYNSGSSEPFLERDPELFWKVRPGVLGHNSQGCSGPEFSTIPAPGVFRIVCLGDSCTHFGPNSYPSILQALLDQEAPDKFEVINAGVIGYTSLQGLKVLQSKVIHWKPDLVTVYFGWNDHWLARDFADKDQTNRISALLRLRNAADHSRTIQLAHLAWSQFGVPRRPGMRVSVEDYGHNLIGMIQLCRGIDADVWLITAPHALDVGIPPYLLSSGEVDDPALLVWIHRQYNSVVRRVAAEQQVTVVDLEDEIDALDKMSHFVDDHIHLSEIGREYAASRLLDQLRKSGIVQEVRIPSPVAP